MRFTNQRLSIVVACCLACGAIERTDVGAASPRPDPEPCGAGSGGSGTPSAQPAPQISGAGVVAGGPAAALEASITLHVRRGVPAAGVRVLWHTPDGALVEDDVTSEDGVANAIVEPGSFVTLVSERHLVGVTFTNLETISGVGPGDVIGPLVNPDAGDSERVEQRLAWPGPVPGATQYAVQVGCGRTSISDSLESLDRVVLTPACAFDGRFQLLAEALDDGNRLVASLVSLGASIGAEPVPLGAWQAPRAALELELVNAPADGIAYVRTVLEKDGLRFWPFATREILLRNGGTATQLSLPPMDVEATLVQYRHVPAAPGAQTSGVTVRLDRLPPRLALDVDPGLPSMQLEPMRPEDGGLALTWRTEGELDLADYQLLTLVHDQRKDRVLFWSFFLPPTARSVRTPALPEPLAGLRTGEPFVPEAALIRVDLEGIEGGWDDVRRGRWPRVSRTTWSGAEFPPVRSRRAWQPRRGWLLESYP